MSKTHEAMLKTHSASSSEWKYLDLKNKKQTGDLAKKILYFNKNNNNTVFNFSSSRGKEGVTTILANLVHYLKLQKIDKKILVIDANFQRPLLHTVFNLNSKNGLADILRSTSGLAETLNEPVSTNINVISCGSKYDEFAGNINYDRFAAIIDEAKQDFDIILIDSAPLLTSSDALLTADCSDITFLLLRAMKIPKEVVERAKSILEENECVIGGVILNRNLQLIPGWVYKYF